MKVSEVREKSADQLKEELLSLRKEQLNLRIQKSTGQLENTARVREVRRDIARIKTVMGEEANGTAVSAKTEKKAAKKTAAKKTKE